MKIKILQRAKIMGWVKPQSDSTAMWIIDLVEEGLLERIEGCNAYRLTAAGKEALKIAEGEADE